MNNPLARAAGVFLSLTAWLAGLASTAHADLNLDRLVCATPVVSLTKDDRIGVTHQELHEALAGRLHARFPRLPTAGTCANTLHLRASVATKTGESGRALGYFGVIRLEVLRTAILLDTLARSEITAWQAEATLSGPAGDERSGITAALDGLLGNFAGSYQRAGNP